MSQQDDRAQHGRARFEAAIASGQHAHKAPGKAEHADDVVIDGEAALGPPDWHKAGRTAPHGWKAVGDTFEETP